MKCPTPLNGVRIWPHPLSGQVLRTLEEPTAAALAFGLHRKPNVNHILVYDLGGGTLDVSLLFVNDGSVEVLGSDGDDNLGGKGVASSTSRPISRLWFNPNSSDDLML